MSATTTTFYRVYVWELPVRAFHWINAACIFGLIATGYVIGSPFAIQYGDEAYQQYWFGTVRFVHFALGFILFFNFLVRIYWGFVGNKYARWHNFFPFTPSQFREIFEVLRVDILLSKKTGNIQMGHNMVAGIIYYVSFLVFLFQSFTGFALYAANSGFWFPRLFTWVVPLMGGDGYVRQWHHMGMWFFVVFTILHIYLVSYHDYVEGRGTTSSIVGGWKFERTDASRDRRPKE